MELNIHWAVRDDFGVEVYARGSRGRLLALAGLSENLRLLHCVRKTDQLLCFVVGDYLAPEFETIRRVAHLFEIDVQQLTILCNYERQLELAESKGLRALLCSPNAFIDERVFRPRYAQKTYHAAWVTRPDKKKRGYLASKVPRLAIVQGYPLPGVEYDDLSAIPHAFMNESIVNREQVAQVLSSSFVGLALSESEGGCLASSECLMCGLPVVSTPSSGGRDHWYTSDNSIICEPHPDSVRDAVREAIAGVHTGRFDAKAIHAGHVSRASEHRSRFVELLGRLLREIDSERSGPELFQRRMDGTGVMPTYEPYDVRRRELGFEGLL